MFYNPNGNIAWLQFFLLTSFVGVGLWHPSIASAKCIPKGNYAISSDGAQVKSGLWVTCASDGTMKRCHYRQGKRDGLCSSYNDNGQLKKEERYKAGLLHGIATAYRIVDSSDVNEDLKEADQIPLKPAPVVPLGNHKEEEANDFAQAVWRCEYADGKLHGTCYTWGGAHESDYAECNYQKGKKHGQCRAWRGQAPTSHITYKAGQLHGRAREWSGESLTFDCEFRDGKKHGYCRLWKEGQLHNDCEFVNGQTHGQCIWHHKNGRMSIKGEMKDGRIVSGTTWHNNGRVSCHADARKRTCFNAAGLKIAVIEMKDKLAHGSITAWHGTTKIKVSGKFAKGLRDGTWQWWYASGAKQETGSYVDGQAEGTAKSWFESGKPHQVSNYSAGKLHGELKEWHENGRRARVEHYNRGAKDGLHMKWNQAGKLLLKCRYKEDKEQGKCTLPLKKGGVLKCNFRDGRKDGACEYRYSTGYRELKTYRNGVLHGRLQRYDGRTPVEKSNYVNGKLHGQRIVYAQDEVGRLEEHYHNGNRTKYVSFHPNRKVASRCSSSPPKSKCIYFSSRGKKLGQCIRVNKKPHGLCFFPGVGLERHAFRGTFVHGRKNGLYEQWFGSFANERPPLTEKCHYRDDKRHGRCKTVTIVGGRVKKMDCDFEDGVKTSRCRH